PGGVGPREAAQAQDEEDGRGQVRRLDEVRRQGRGAGGFPGPGWERNIFSIRSVMMKPPTTLMVAEATAIAPSTLLRSPRPAPAATSEPTSEMPEMALVADMSGVCSSGGTRVMTLKPTNPARMKTYSSTMAS